MEYSIETRRSHKRLKLPLSVRVRIRDREGRERIEMTRLQDVTPLGARFTLASPVESGQLIQLTMAMPPQLRRYDVSEQLYHVWAVVRHTRAFKLFSAGNVSAAHYEVGLAFVGQHAPESFTRDPGTRYEIDGLGDDGFWRLREPEPEPEAAPEPPASEEVWQEVERLRIPVEVLIEVLGDGGKVIASEETVSSNIGMLSAVVPTTLEVKSNHLIRLTSVMTNFSVDAVVKGQDNQTEGVTRLYLNYINGSWPAEELNQA